MVRRMSRERPRAGEVARRHRRGWMLCPSLRWLLPLVGLGSLVWFLVRVIPKPSRAAYPCQRVAFPLASGFVLWLLGLAGSLAAFRKARRCFTGVRLLAGMVCLGLGVAVVWLLVAPGDERAVAGGFPVPNVPLGTALTSPTPPSGRGTALRSGGTTKRVRTRPWSTGCCRGRSAVWRARVPMRRRGRGFCAISIRPAEKATSATRPARRSPSRSTIRSATTPIRARSSRLAATRIESTILRR